MEIFVCWIVMNLIVLILLLGNMQHEEGWWDALIYPKIHEWLNNQDVDGPAVVFTDIMISLLFAPALIVYFVILGAMLLIAFGLIWVLDRPKK